MAKTNIERFEDVLKQRRLKYGGVYHDIHFKKVKDDIVALYCLNMDLGVHLDTSFSDETLGISIDSVVTSISINLVLNSNNG